MVRRVVVGWGGQEVQARVRDRDKDRERERERRASVFSRACRAKCQESHATSPRFSFSLAVSLPFSPLTCRRYLGGRSESVAQRDLGWDMAFGGGGLLLSGGFLRSRSGAALDKCFDQAPWHSAPGGDKILFMCLSRLGLPLTVPARSATRNRSPCLQKPIRRCARAAVHTTCLSTIELYCRWLMVCCPVFLVVPLSLVPLSLPASAGGRWVSPAGRAQPARAARHFRPPPRRTLSLHPPRVQVLYSDHLGPQPTGACASLAISSQTRIRACPARRLCVTVCLPESLWSWNDD